MSPRATGCARDVVVLLDKLIYVIARRWLLLANTFWAVFIALPLLAPVFMANGLPQVGQLIHQVYAPDCHQLPERSYFFYGKQYYYSLPELRELVGPDVPLRYVGDPLIGYKVAVCERDVAIYGTLAIAGIAFGLVRRRLYPLGQGAFLRFAALFALPMAVDGFGQLFGFWESNWISRTITGAVAAAGAVWLVYPYIEKGMLDVQRTIIRQLHLEELPDSGAARDRTEHDQAQDAQNQ
jgi:uncharacterized membrane protein